LVNIHKVLINDGKEFVERVDREASEDIAKMTPEERREKFYKTFTLAQKLMDSADARKKSLEGKTYKDVEMKNQFDGSHEQGKKTFERIKSQHSINPQQTGYLEDNGNMAVINNEVYLPVNEPSEVDQFQYNIIQQDLRAGSNIPLNTPTTIGGGIAVALIGSVFSNRKSYFKKSLS